MAGKLFKIVVVNVFVLLVLWLFLEAALQAIALVRPSYEVMFLQPDKVVGWKQVPGLRWTWTGSHWFASEFSVVVETNPQGFRDKPRDPAKPDGVKRVALLGDSFVEAVQVPFEKTAGQLLEQRLNDSSHQNPGQAPRWEVLNFGISGHGVGQYLLAWEQYAKDYQPDYVAILVAKFHMRRSVLKQEYGGFRASKKKKLWIRPTFRLENDELVREPARDFNEFVKTQEHLINTAFSGQRTRRKKQVITFYYARQFKEQLASLFPWLGRKPRPAGPLPPTDSNADDTMVTINRKIIEELGRKVARAGSRLVIVDAARYFADDEIISALLKEACSKNGFGYVPLYEDLLKSDAGGIPTRWARDGHFNEAGNEVFAQALFAWMTPLLPVNKSPSNNHPRSNPP